MTGTFITFEGPEGGGKSLQVARLAGRLRDLGMDVVQTREPGGTGVGDAIRAVLLGAGDYTMVAETEVLLMAASRAQLVREVIGPALARGATVICDRYVDSTYAYQGGGRGVALDALKPIQAFATGGLVPDFRVLLDLPVEVGLQRRHADAGSLNRIDLDSLEFHERVRATYLQLAAADPTSWIIVDAQGDPDSVQLHIWSRLQDRLALA